MAFYKFNRLHLHLTDNQGWRIEIKEYPKLVEIASKRKETDGNNKPHEGYYTKADLQELVGYAKSRFVEIIPEIDMPGHNQAALTDYPQSEGDGHFTSWMPILPLEQAYGFDPSFGLSDDDFILGVEGCLWGEYMPNINKVFYMTYPRALALSEAGWTYKDNKSWNRFKEKLPGYLSYLLQDGVLHRPPVELFTHKEYRCYEKVCNCNIDCYG